MDYAQFLREEGKKAHSVFHSVILDLPSFNDSIFLAFFEGQDDPSFYLPHLRAKNKNKEYKSYICDGRQDVLKVLSLIEIDGRAISRSMFFIDKDHNDFLGICIKHPKLFETKFYSIENYLVNSKMISAFWVEILHLDATDSREKYYQEKFNNIRNHFARRMQTLMALVLIGRGINNHLPRKLNLNNVNLDLIFKINFEEGICRYKPGAGEHFAKSSNVIEYKSPGTFFNKRKTIKMIINTYFKERDNKEFIRGKYELWLLLKFMQNSCQKLSSKNETKSSGLKRATPNISLSQNSIIEILAPRSHCPYDLESFLEEFFKNFDQKNAENFVLN